MHILTLPWKVLEHLIIGMDFWLRYMTEKEENYLLFSALFYSSCIILYKSDSGHKFVSTFLARRRGLSTWYYWAQYLCLSFLWGSSNKHWIWVKNDVAKMGVLKSTLVKVLYLVKYPLLGMLPSQIHFLFWVYHLPT